MYSTIAHKIKRSGNGRGKPDRMSLKYKKKEARLEVRIIENIAKQTIILMLSSSLAYAFPSYYYIDDEEIARIPVFVGRKKWTSTA